MSKHSNKYWLKEKEYISLKIESDSLWNERCYYRNYVKSVREEEICRKFLYKFFEMEHHYLKTAPKWYRKHLNQIQRTKQKRVIYKIVNGKYDYVFEDNYKDAPWYW